MQLRPGWPGSARAGPRAVGGPGSRRSDVRSPKTGQRRCPAGLPPRSSSGPESSLLQEVARSAATALAVLFARSTLGGAARGLSRPDESGAGARRAVPARNHETIRAVLLDGDLRGFPELSETGTGSGLPRALVAWLRTASLVLFTPSAAKC